MLAPASAQEPSALSFRRLSGRGAAHAGKSVMACVWEFAAEDAVEALQARAEFLEVVRVTPLASAQTAIELVFSELVSNVVKHAPGAIALAFEVGMRRAVLRVYDGGAGFLLRLSVPSDSFAESGRGLFLAHEFCSELKVETSSRGGTCVSAIFDF